MSVLRLVAIVVASVLLLPQIALTQQETPFEAGCQLPFQQIAVKHSIDESCGIGGVASPEDIGNQQQNRIKNNFCLTSAPISLKPQDLITLQSKVDSLDGFTYGSGRSVPTDRSPLKDIWSANGKRIGEGTLVVLVGYMLDPHYSDVRKGEGVNCKQHGDEPNDIHFSISSKWVELDDLDKQARQAQLCKLVTGEISPHFRPETWEVDHLSKLERIPVRLTGQLFFDASHLPCRPEKPVNPARKSVWEIHPIYRVDVCKGKKQCRGNVDSDWVALDDWINSREEEDTSEND
jgi:hypothetical protein